MTGFTNKIQQILIWNPNECIDQGHNDMCCILKYICILCPRVYAGICQCHNVGLSWPRSCGPIWWVVDHHGDISLTVCHTNPVMVLTVASQWLFGLKYYLQFPETTESTANWIGVLSFENTSVNYIYIFFTSPYCNLYQRLFWITTIALNRKAVVIMTSCLFVLKAGRPPEMW